MAPLRPPLDPLGPGCGSTSLIARSAPGLLPLVEGRAGPVLPLLEGRLLLQLQSAGCGTLGATVGFIATAFSSLT